MIKIFGERVVKTRLMSEGWTLNLFGILLTRHPEMLTAEVVNHELIHTAQQRELLWVGFYLLYGLEWLVRLVMTLSPMKAYLTLSFEREAYSMGNDLTYLKRRKPYAQWRNTR